MVQVLFIQGAGVGGSDKFIADIKQAMPADDRIDAPVMPLADDPSAARWLPAVGHALGQQNQPFVAVGHSLGGSTLLQWLGANPAPAHLLAVITVAAPFWGDGGWGASEFSLPPGAGEHLWRIKCLMLNGDADETVEPSHPGLYQQLLPHVRTRIVAGMDHEWTGGGATLMHAVHGVVA